MQSLKEVITQVTYEVTRITNIYDNVIYLLEYVISIVLKNNQSQQFPFTYNMDVISAQSTKQLSQFKAHVEGDHLPNM